VHIELRTEQEMYDLIIRIANADERIRAVYMNGSRTNTNIIKDKYQVYDIVFVVTETGSFLTDKNWISKFGEIAIVQEPEWNDIQTGLYSGQHDSSRHYAWLMLFKDGNRIDLGIEIKEEAEKNFVDDKLTVLLLDKDGFLPKIPSPTDEDYHVKKPKNDEYTAICNDFWWSLNNVAKGIARDELPYAMEMYNLIVRTLMNKMVDWYIGVKTDFSVSTGKMGKFYKKYLPPELYDLYAKTYSDSDYNNMWTAVFTACEMFRITALEVGYHFDFIYNEHWDKSITDYLYKVRKSWNCFVGRFLN